MYDITRTLIAKKRVTITLSGLSGTANITGTGGLTKLLTFGTSLTASAAAFVVSHAAAYLALTPSVVVTSVYETLVFNEAVEGSGFTDPVITNATGDLTGSVYSTLYPEPVTLQEMKEFILNRSDEDVQQDALLRELITTSRELAEQFCNRSFIPQTIEYTEYLQVRWSEEIPEFVLPFPNHLSLVEVKIADIATTEYEAIGINRYTIQFTGRYYTTDILGTKFYIKYTAGECNSLVKNAIMQICKDMYENRGKDPMSSNGFIMLNSQKVY